MLLSSSVSAQSPDAIAKCVSMPLRNQPACFESITPKKKENAVSEQSNFVEYQKIILETSRNLLLARFAGMCRLRSDAYFMDFISAGMRHSQLEAKRLGISAAQMYAADANAQRILQKESSDAGRPSLGVTCQRIRNSPAMDRLDQAHRLLTGGYH